MTYSNLQSAREMFNGYLRFLPVTYCNVCGRSNHHSLGEGELKLDCPNVGLESFLKDRNAKKEE